MMTFKEVTAINIRRSRRWMHGVDWSVVDWSNAMAGEAGEVCNAVKKLRRIECGMRQLNGPVSREDAVVRISKEIGDTFLYLNLLANHLGLTMEDCIRHAFNETSDKESFPERL
jgi:NTP pyrophosphatase (non-canonical NTP hydrolase)